MLKQLNSLVLFVFILLLSAPADAQVWNKRKMDEAAAKMRMEINSKLEELDVLDRRVMQLEIEIEAIKREKDEEVGSEFKVKIFPTYSTNAFFVKKDGSRMVLPHYYAVHEEGEIKLNEEYSEYTWVPLVDIYMFEPKIPNIPEIITKLESLKQIQCDTDSVII